MCFLQLCRADNAVGILDVLDAAHDGPGAMAQQLLGTVNTRRSSTRVDSNHATVEEGSQAMAGTFKWLAGMPVLGWALSQESHEDILQSTALQAESNSKSGMQDGSKVHSNNRLNSTVQSTSVAPAAAGTNCAEYTLSETQAVVLPSDDDAVQSYTGQSASMAKVLQEFDQEWENHKVQAPASMTTGNINLPTRGDAAPSLSMTQHWASVVAATALLSILALAAVVLRRVGGSDAAGAQARSMMSGLATTADVLDRPLQSSYSVVHTSVDTVMDIVTVDVHASVEDGSSSTTTTGPSQSVIGGAMG